MQMLKIVEGVVVIRFSSVKEPRLVTTAEPRLNLGSSPRALRLQYLGVLLNGRTKTLRVVPGTCKFLPLSKPSFSHYKVEIIIPVLMYLVGGKRL